MVEKPPLDRYHTYREVEAPGGPGGEWRHFYQPHKTIFSVFRRCLYSTIYYI